eukprot:c13184_g1_i2.p1 GENE.c13184_g1_i2~~c13184_g1_i2.p1  ORF type:complete len:352 (-),score=35.34 c13184_g1_i2:363-1418(-)
MICNCFFLLGLLNLRGNCRSFVHTDGLVHTIYPFILTCISDHAEGNSLALLEMLACRYCTQQKQQYATSDHIGEPRTQSDMRRVLELAQQHPTQLHEAGIDPTPNPLWNSSILPFDPFLSCHCIFHDIDEGIWKWVLNEMLIPSFSPTDHAQFYSLACNISFMSHFKRRSEVTKKSVKFLSAKYLRHLLVQMVLVLAGWTFMNDSRDTQFELVLQLCNWYAIVRARECSEGDLEKMEREGIRLHQMLRDTSILWLNKYDTHAIKHHVFLHYPELVRRFGTMIHQSCEKWDGAHKAFIKAPLTTHGSARFQETVERRVSCFFFEIIFFPHLENHDILGTSIRTRRCSSCDLQ